MSEVRPLLVGELNPYGEDPRFALYPEPENSAGGRLCRLVLGLDKWNYLRRFDRVNLCAGKWSLTAARVAAKEILADAVSRPSQERPAAVLLGAKVAAAWGATFAPFTVTDYGTSMPIKRVVILPHPSGLCRLWNEPGAFERARAVLREAGVLGPA